MCVSKLIFHFMGEFKSWEPACLFCTWCTEKQISTTPLVCVAITIYTAETPWWAWVCQFILELSVSGSWLQRGPVSLCTVHVPGVHRGLEEGIRSLGAEIVSKPSRCWELNPGLLQDQQVLLTTVVCPVLSKVFFKVRAAWSTGDMFQERK